MGAGRRPPPPATAASDRTVAGRATGLRAGRSAVAFCSQAGTVEWWDVGSWPGRRLVRLEEAKPDSPDSRFVLSPDGRQVAGLVRRPSSTVDATSCGCGTRPTGGCGGGPGSAARPSGGSAGCRTSRAIKLSTRRWRGKRTYAWHVASGRVVTVARTRLIEWRVAGRTHGGQCGFGTAWRCGRWRPTGGCGPGQ